MVSGDDGETSIFAGVDDTDRPANSGRQEQLDETAAVAPAGAALDPAAIGRRFVGDLTIREVHAFIWGFAPWFLALAVQSAVLLTVAIFVTATIVGFLRAPANRDATALVREPHYGLAGAVLGWFVGASVLAILEMLAALAVMVG